LWRFCKVVLNEKNDILLVDKRNIIDWYNSEVYPKLKAEGSKIISMDESLQGDYRLDVCRITDPESGKVIGIGSRIGKPPLEEQIERILPGNYWLVDEGTFTGDSIITLTKLLREYDIVIEGVVLGIVTNDGYSRITNKFGSNVIYYTVEPVVEWADGRDAIGLDGRVTPDEKLIPYYTNPQWLSLPESCQETLKQIWRITQAILRKYGVRLSWIVR